MPIVYRKARSRHEGHALITTKTSEDTNEGSYLTCWDVSGVLSRVAYLTCGSGISMCLTCYEMTMPVIGTKALS